MLIVTPHSESARIGVFGGSGFYEFMDHLREVHVETPYGDPSGPIMVGDIDGCEMAFVARHGAEHTIPAHVVNYRANIWAMKSLGVEALLSPFACGSLRTEHAPGDLVLVDQLVDRTHGREGTFFDGPLTHHVTFADPYDAELGAQLCALAAESGITIHRGGTVVVIPGPRFSTRAESRWHAQMGWDLVNMTQAPEAALAAEASIRFIGIGMVTDYDAGLDGDPSIEPVTEEQVFAFLGSNADVMRSLLSSAVPRLQL